jgi:hypothetical protein
MDIEQGRRTRCRVIIPAVLFALIASTPLQAVADRPAAWVGAWFSETKENKDVGGDKYDVRRELLVNRADGTKTNTFRYYDNGRLVKEFVVTYEWGVDGKTYWSVCRTILVSGDTTPCSARFEYDIVAVSAREIRYKSRKTGIDYTAIRVADDFKLP